MNCSEWEERLALYAGGDLLPPDQAAVEHHVQDCAGCQVFLSGMTESLRAMKEAHTEVIAPAHFTAVRTRVLAELARRSRPWYLRRWVLGWAMGAAALSIAIWVWVGRAPVAPPRVARTAPPREVSAPPRLLEPPRTAVMARAPRPRRVVRPKPAPERAPDASAKPLVVKLVTDDPDVVIYWITETRGE